MARPIPCPIVRPAGSGVNGKLRPDDDFITVSSSRWRKALGVNRTDNPGIRRLMLAVSVTKRVSLWASGAFSDRQPRRSWHTKEAMVQVSHERGEPVVGDVKK
jgi:hypothetical protein